MMHYHDAKPHSSYKSTQTLVKSSMRFRSIAKAHKSLVETCWRTCRGISGAQLRLGQNAPHFTEEQIREISKHDALLAEQIRRAKEHGVRMSWQDPGTHQQDSYLESGTSSGLADFMLRL
eukprot:s6101_g3.t1